MSPTAPSRHLPSGAHRESLLSYLRDRHGEIEEAALARMYAISDPMSLKDPAYVAGLHEAVSSGLAYGLAAIESPAARSSAPIPVQLLAQARYAARSGVSLDTVLRRYFSGYTLLTDFLVRAAADAGTPACDLQRAMRAATIRFERLVASVSEEYVREAEGTCHSAADRCAAHVRMLLEGELLDPVELDYELDAWHIGAIATGAGARAAVRELATALDRNLLAVRPEGGVVWAWFGGRQRPSSREILRQAEASWSGDGIVAIGDPGHGLQGWRLSHRQAKAALSIAAPGDRGPIPYPEVALVASALQDEILASSLRESYLAPLEREKDGGRALRETLSAYLAARRNISSAAAALGVSRQTVKNRLAAAEELYDCPLDARATEIETALRLHDAGAANVTNLQSACAGLQ